MIFFKNNLTLLTFYFLALAGVFTFVTILPTLLKSYYGISTQVLAYGSTIFIASYTVSSIYHTYHMDKTVGVFKTSIILYIVDIISISSLILAFSLDLLSIDTIITIFLISRAFNGWCGGGITTITGYIIKLKLYSSKNNNRLNGIIDSIYSSIKYIMPIFGAFSSELLTPSTPIFIGLFLMISSMALLIKYKRKIHFHYLYNLKKVNHQGSHLLSKGFKEYFKKNKYRPVRIQYLVNLLFRNATRPYFDFYIPLLLITSYSYKVSDAAIISSWLIIGMTLQFTTSGLISKLTTGWYQSISNLFTAAVILILIYNPIIFENSLYLSVFMFLIGVSNGMNGNWRYKMINRIGKDGIKLSHSKLIGDTAGGISVYIVLILFGALSTYSNEIDLVNIVMMLIAVGLILISILEIFMDSRYKKSKK